MNSPASPRQIVIWFSVERWNARINLVQVIKETEKTVSVLGKWAKGRVTRSEKEGSSEKYFKTWAEAYAYLLKRTEAQVKDAQRALEIANAALERVKEMKGQS